MPLVDENAETSPAQSSDLTGTTIVGRFNITKRLGRGGMGEVYLANDTKLKRQVALKRVAAHVRRDPQYRQRLLHEAELASALNDTHIAIIYDAFDEGSETFVVMEYVEGENLRQRLRRSINLTEFLDIATQCAAALVAAHERGILHLDIKPENIVLTSEGKIKVLDFGVARRLPGGMDATTVSQASGVAGTPAYLAPEALLEQGLDGRADIFSLGVVFYETLTGISPFRADSFAGASDRVLHEIPAPVATLNRNVPPELDRMVGKMIAKNREQRYATAADLLVDLHALQRAQPHPRQLWPGRRVTRISPVVYVAVAAMLGFLVILSYRHWTRQSNSATPSVSSTTKRLAVLPLENLSGRSEDDYFADGLTEELIAKFSRIRSLEVISRVSVMRFKKASVALPDIARQLDVGYVVSGSVRRAGSNVRITVTLEDANRQTQIWAQEYDRSSGDVLKIESEIAEDVVRELPLVPQAEERAALIAPITQDPSAFDAYLRGKSLVEKFNNQGAESDFVAAEKQLRAAVAADRLLAAAYAELARLYYFHDLERARPTSDRHRAWSNAEHALAIDGKQVTALAALAMMYAWEDENEKAYAYAQRALEANPHEARALMALGGTYENWGLLPQALEAFRRAGRADPLYPYPWTNAAHILWMLDRFDDAWAENQKAAVLEPDNWSVLLTAIRIRYYQGRLDESAQLIADAQKRLPARERPLVDLLEVWVLSRQGQHAQARSILNRSLREPILQNWPDPQMQIAEALALGGQTGKAIEILEKIAPKEPNYPWLARNPNFDPLRSNPRFQALLGAVHQQWVALQARYGQAASN